MASAIWPRESLVSTLDLQKASARHRGQAFPSMFAGKGFEHTGHCGVVDEVSGMVIERSLFQKPGTKVPPALS